jgi:hypothetical protein
MSTTNERLIGRDHVDDLEAILAVRNTDVDEVVHAVRMRDRFLQQEVWERMGLSAKQVLPLVLVSPQRMVFQQMVFSKIVPNCKKLGLLDANGGWLRRRFTEMGVIQFEDNPDTGEEYSMFQLAAGAN